MSCERLIQHALVCAAHIDYWRLTFWEARNLLLQAGFYFYQQVQYWEAEPLWADALSICEQVMGPEYPETLGYLNNLAILYEDQGKHEQAEPLLQRALSASERVLGPEHPETIKIRNNYADLQEKMKRKTEVARSKPWNARKRAKSSSMNN
jgi:tetratricopeptide (TPR) repeat protein